MNFEVDIEGAEELIDSLNEIFSPENVERLNKVGVTSSLLAVKEYHNEFDSSGGWKNLSLPTHGAGRNSTGFGNNVTRAWSEGEVSPEGASIVNNFPLLSHKITGGTIRPKTSKFLTIPMVPQAHGVRARDYTSKLFFLSSKDDTKGVLAEGEGESLRIVYLLRKSVTQSPVEGALPPDETITNSFVDAINEELDQIL